METELHKKLMAQAGKLLARRAYSRAELGERLARLAESDEVDRALDHLVELRLLNDANYAYNLSLHRLTREGWGPLRVRRELIERRVEPATADEALARVLDETGEETILKRYLVRYAGRRGWPGDRRRIQRLVLHLERRGFSAEQVHRALRDEIGTEAWRRFETGE